jgi:hypothetical protein
MTYFLAYPWQNKILRMNMNIWSCNNLIFWIKPKLLYFNSQILTEGLFYYYWYVCKAYMLIKMVSEKSCPEILGFVYVLSPPEYWASKCCFGQKLSHGFGFKTDIVCSNFGRFYKLQWVHLILHVHRKPTGEHAIIFYPISQTYRIIN